MYDRPAVVSLSAYLAAVVAKQPSAIGRARQEELRQLVCDVVDEFKSSGWPPERIIVAVKRIAADAGVFPSRDILSSTSALKNQDAALVNMVRWCIDRYYDVRLQRL